MFFSTATFQLKKKKKEKKFRYSDVDNPISLTPIFHNEKDEQIGKKGKK